MGAKLGIIVAWSGFAGTFPQGWVLCDGTLGTPDLRDRFIMGAGLTAPGVIGGVDSYDETHSHGMPGTMQFDSDDHVHGLGGFTVDPNSAPVGTATWNVPNQTGTVVLHVHSNGISWSEAYPHTHAIESGLTKPFPGTLSRLPPYYALAFLMKKACSGFQEVVRSIAQSTDDADSTLGVAAGYVRMAAAHGGTGGLRFQNIQVPQGATIQLAYVASAFDFVGTLLQIWGEASDNALTFAPANLPNLRTKTAAMVSGWMGAQGYFATTNVTTIIQEVVNRPGWVAGNALAILMEADGAGRYDIFSYDYDPLSASKLIIEYG